MLTIARRQILNSMLDAKFVFTALLILLAFAANGIIFSSRYQQLREDYRVNEAENSEIIRSRCDNLQRLAILEQRILQPPRRWNSSPRAAAVLYQTLPCSTPSTATATSSSTAATTASPCCRRSIGISSWGY